MSFDPLTWVLMVSLLLMAALICCPPPPADVYTGPGGDGHLLGLVHLNTLDNLRVTAPNAKIFGDFIANYTKPNRRRVSPGYPRRQACLIPSAMIVVSRRHSRVPGGEA